MVHIYYKFNNLIDEECNYLDIAKKDREYLVEVLDSFNFDDDIELNIIKFGYILKELKGDPRIREDLRYPLITNYSPGKNISKEELKDPFKECKICYCAQSLDFSHTIVIIFHELNHFTNPFDLSELIKEVENNPDNVSIDILLEFQVKNALNEYAANKKVVEQLSGISELKKVIISEGKNFFRRIFTMITQPINSLSKRNKISKYFDWGFIRFFRYLGYWKGFQEIKEVTEIEEGWQDFISLYHFDFIDLDIFKSLKSAIETFNCNFEEIFRVFKNFF
jgi:hypothetical protein